MALTDEPILLKQSEEGVRVQIDDQPMMPLAAFMGQEVAAALGRPRMRVSQAFGSRWTALVTSPRTATARSSASESTAGRVRR